MSFVRISLVIACVSIVTPLGSAGLNMISPAQSFVGTWRIIRPSDETPYLSFGATFTWTQQDQVVLLSQRGAATTPDWTFRLDGRMTRNFSAGGFETESSCQWLGNRLEITTTPVSHPAGLRVLRTVRLLWLEVRDHMRIDTAVTTSGGTSLSTSRYGLEATHSTTTTRSLLQSPGSRSPISSIH